MARRASRPLGHHLPPSLGRSALPRPRPPGAGRAGVTFRDLLFGTFRTLWAHKLRTALTMFGIAWGIVSVTLMVAAGEGLRVGQKRVADSFARDLMIIFPGRTSLQAGGMRAGRSVQLMDADHAIVQRESPSCAWVLPALGQDSIPV